MPKKTAPANETPEQKFVRLANGRAGAAMLAIDNLAKLVGSQYKSTPEQHDKLINAINHRLLTAKAALTANKPAAKVREGVL